MSNWNSLTASSQLETLTTLSDTVPVMIFKHSTRCGVSSHVKDTLKSDWNFASGEIEFYYLDLIAFRDISNKIAEKFGVRHQSPQAILLHKGEAVYDSSHYSISVDKIRKVLDQI